MQKTSNAGVQNTQEEKFSHWQVLNPVFYAKQFIGWTKTSYSMLAIGWVIISFISFGMGSTINGFTWLTWLASGLGWTTVIAIKEAKPFNGLFGMLSALIYIYVAWVHSNPADAVLQLTYIILLDLPVLLIPSWVKNAEKKVRFIHETDIRGEKLGKKFWYTAIIIIAVIAFTAAYFFETLVLHTPRPISDSLVLGTGLVGAVLTTFRFSESWYAWLLQGAMQIVLWTLTVLAGGVLGPSALVILVTYLMYFANDITALFQSPWFHHKQYNEEARNKNSLSVSRR